MDKRFNQFTAGAYDGANIILQADPVTGAVTKLPLSAIQTGFPWLTYLAKVTQTGTNAPTAIESPANNITGGVWSRQAVGTYRYTLAGTFLNVSTFLLVGSPGNGSAMTFKWLRGNDDYITFITFDSAGNATDGIADDITLQILTDLP